MRFSLYNAGMLPPIIVALTTMLVIALLGRLRAGKRRWPIVAWIVLPIGGVIAAIVVRAAESLVLDVAVGGRLVGAEGVRQGLIAFGIVGPLDVLMLTAIVWAMLTRVLHDEVDPPLAAAVAGAGFVLGRLATTMLLERASLGTGVRAGILGAAEVSLAATWGYGLARSAFDGRLGGTPFGRYALGIMVVRGAVELSVREPGPVAIAFAIGVATIALGFAALGIARLSGSSNAPPSSLASLGQETIREIARSELRRGGVRPAWIILGALGNLGGIVLGFAGAVVIGASAHIDFGEIDRNGPAAEYAALLLALGVIMSFPISAAVVGLAGGGRNERQRPFLLEAGLSSIVALGALLLALGVVAPVAVALGIACAPVAFMLAGLGAWIAVGRKG